MYYNVLYNNYIYIYISLCVQPIFIGMIFGLIIHWQVQRVWMDLIPLSSGISQPCLLTSWLEINGNYMYISLHRHIYVLAYLLN